MTHDEVTAAVPAEGERVRVAILLGRGDDGEEYVGGSVVGRYEGLAPEGMCKPDGGDQPGGIRVQGTVTRADGETHEDVTALIAFAGIESLSA